MIRATVAWGETEVGYEMRMAFEKAMREHETGLVRLVLIPGQIMNRRAARIHIARLARHGERSREPFGR